MGSVPSFLIFLRRNLSPDIFRVIHRRANVANASQRRALRNYRRRLGARGMARFEVLGLDADRELIRALAKRLAQNDVEASRIRAEASRIVAGEPPRKGGILAALRRSPLVGAELKLGRASVSGRAIEL
jgi:hypothetical protein